MSDINTFTIDNFGSFLEQLRNNSNESLLTVSRNTGICKSNLHTIEKERNTNFKFNTVGNLMDYYNLELLLTVRPKTSSRVADRFKKIRNRRN